MDLELRRSGSSFRGGPTYSRYLYCCSFYSLFRRRLNCSVFIYSKVISVMDMIKTKTKGINLGEGKGQDRAGEIEWRVEL